MVVLVSEGHCPSISRYTRFWYGAVASALGTVFGAINSNHQEKMQIAENQKNRDFAREMAQYQNEQNIEMWKRNNEYNTPAAQVSRMRAAGLNPALMYAGGSPAVPSVAPAMSGGNGANGSVGGNFAPFDALSASRMQAEIRNIDADTKQKESQTGLNITETEIRQGLKNGMIEKQNMEIRLGNSQADLTDKEITKITPLINNLNAHTDYYTNLSNNEVIKSGIYVSESDIKEIEKNFKSKELQAIIDNLASQTGLSRAHTREVLTLLSLKAANIKADTDVKGSMSRYFNSSSDVNVALGSKIKWEENRIIYDLGQDIKFQDYERTLKIIDSFMTDIKSALDILFRGLDESRKTIDSVLSIFGN